MIKNIEIIKEILELDLSVVDKISENTGLEDYNWDSLAMVNLITLISSDYDIEIEFDQFDEIETFGQLDKIITSIIINK